jgi:hypothetical protein
MSFHPSPYHECRVSKEVEDPAGYYSRLIELLEGVRKDFPGDTNIIGFCIDDLLHQLMRPQRLGDICPSCGRDNSGDGGGECRSDDCPANRYDTEMQGFRIEEIKAPEQHPGDPDTPAVLTCAHCARTISFALGEVYSDGSSYVCFAHRNGA